MSTNPGVDGYAVALYRRLSPPYGCVICGESVSCRTVNCWVRLPCGLRHAILLLNDLQKGNTPDSTFCALADLVRLPGRCRGRIAVRLQARHRRPLPDSGEQSARVYGLGVASMASAPNPRNISRDAPTKVYTRTDAARDAGEPLDARRATGACFVPALKTPLPGSAPVIGGFVMPVLRAALYVGSARI